MSEAKGQGSVIEVGEEEFDVQVLEASRQKPVLVDFWAAWCGPCLALAPVLERLAEEFGGSFQLAKVNIEETPGLARAFEVQGIPLVVLFRDGEPVDQFTGALPEGEIRTFLKRYCETPADQVVAQGQTAFEQGRPDEARQRFEQVLEGGEHPGALMGLACLAWEGGRVDEVESYLRRIDPLSPEAERADELRARIEFARLCQDWGGLEATRDDLARDTEDLELAYRLACCQAADGSYREALEGMLRIVRKDRRFRDEEPRKAMLKIFRIVGDRSPLAEEYRTRLSRAIF